MRMRVSGKIGNRSRPSPSSFSPHAAPSPAIDGSDSVRRPLVAATDSIRGKIGNRSTSPLRARSQHAPKEATIRKWSGLGAERRVGGEVPLSSNNGNRCPSELAPADTSYTADY